MNNYERSPIRALIDELSAITGYLGVLQYGSRARGDNNAESDYDLIVVTEHSIGVERLHAQKVDLNFLTGDELLAILHRLKRQQSMPWDTMLADVVVLDDENGELQSLARDIASSINNQPVYSDAIAGLRFLVWHFLKKLAEADESRSLEAETRVFSAISAIAAAHGIVTGQPWQGLDMAIRQILTDAPEIYNKLNDAANARNNWGFRVDQLQVAAREVLRDSGGLWDGRELELSSWIENRSQSSVAQVPPRTWDRIREAMRQLGNREFDD